MMKRQICTFFDVISFHIKKKCQQIVEVCVRVSKQFNRPLFQSYVVFMPLAAVKQLESR